MSGPHTKCCKEARIPTKEFAPVMGCTETHISVFRSVYFWELGTSFSSNSVPQVVAALYN